MKKSFTVSEKIKFEVDGVFKAKIIRRKWESNPRRAVHEDTTITPPYYHYTTEIFFNSPKYSSIFFEKMDAFRAKIKIFSIFASIHQPRSLNQGQGSVFMLGKGSKDFIKIVVFPTGCKNTLYVSVISYFLAFLVDVFISRPIRHLCLIFNEPEPVAV
jgi:hypothetical protein